MVQFLKTFVVIMSVFFTVNVKAENLNKKFLSSADFVRFTNAFISLEEIYSAYQGTGMITAEDRSQILSFLQNKGIDVKARTPKVVTVDNSFLVGQISLRRHSDGVYKTPSGVSIIVGAKDSAFTLFKKSYAILEDEKQAGLWLKLFMPEAQAQSTVKPGTNIATALGPMLLEALFIRDVATVMAVIPNFVGGALAHAWNFLPEMIDNGKVECLGIDYVYTSGFSKKIKSYAEDVTPEGACKALRKEDVHQLFAGRLCEFAYRSDIFFSKSIDRTADRFYVPKDRLKNYFSTNPFPTCTKKNAQIVQEGLKADAKKVASQLTENSKTAPTEIKSESKNKSNVQGKDLGKVKSVN